MHLVTTDADKQILYVYTLYLSKLIFLNNKMIGQTILTKPSDHRIVIPS